MVHPAGLECLPGGGAGVGASREVTIAGQPRSLWFTVDLLMSPLLCSPSQALSGCRENSLLKGVGWVQPRKGVVDILPGRTESAHTPALHLPPSVLLDPTREFCPEAQQARCAGEEWSPGAAP